MRGKYFARKNIMVKMKASKIIYLIVKSKGDIKDFVMHRVRRNNPIFPSKKLLARLNSRDLIRYPSNIAIKGASHQK
ncbi:hypothetical protein D3C81_2231780 [compost metagenome]